MAIEIGEDNGKKIGACNFKVSEREERDIVESALALGLDKSEYIRFSIFIAKPFLFFIKKHFSFFLTLLSKMHGEQ